MKVTRDALSDARDMRLYFAQVREDPLLELAALAPTAGERHVVVSSGGCTALSLVAGGAGEVVAVDLNRTQNHLVELKAAAASLYGADTATAFLGGAPCSGWARRTLYDRLRESLSPAARRYWDARRSQIARGVLGCGVTERFMAFLMAVIRVVVHGPRRMARLLRLSTLAEQRRFYANEWNSRRWRVLFGLLLNRWVFKRAYDPGFFRHVDNPSFARHFHRLAEHGLTNIPVASNYFLQYLFARRYPTEAEGGVPPYLDRSQATAERLRRGRLTLVDGSLVEWLRRAPARSIDGFALSNICEWLTPSETEALFGEIVRTARPGARLVFRNFVGWTEVPARWRPHVVEDRALGEQLIAADRSLVQRRIAVCAIVAADTDVGRAGCSETRC